MKRLRQALFALPLLLVLLFVFRGFHSPYYTIEPFESWIVDDETGAPIEGAVMVATWELYRESLHNAQFHEMAAVKESLSDKNGRVNFEGFALLNPSMHYLREDPKIIVFKGGYEYYRAVNPCHTSSIQGDCRWAARLAVVAGKTIRLKKLDYSNTPKEGRPKTSMEHELYRGLVGELTYVDRSGKSGEIPQFVKAVDQEMDRLRNEGYSYFPNLPRFR